MDNLTCLDFIIGLSKTVCPCFDDDKPGDFDTSKSNLFVDQLPGIQLKMVEATEDCENGNLWEILERARHNAIQEFETDLLACVANISKQKRKPFRGFIGERDFTGVEEPQGTFVGWKLEAPNLLDSYMRIKSISTLMDTTIGAFNLEIYSSLSDIALFTIPLASESQKIKENVLVTPILLPLFDDKCGEEIEYFFLYKPIGFKPLNNNIDCDCPNKDTRYKNFLCIDGTFGEDPTTIIGQEAFSETGKANGLCFEMDVFCRLDDAICQYTVDESDVMFKVIAKAIQYKAGELTLEYANSSGQINRFSLLGREAAWGKRNHYRSQYETRILSLCGDVDLSDSDCISCENQIMQNVTVGS